MHILLSLALVLSLGYSCYAQSTTNSVGSAIEKVNQANKKVISNPESAFDLALKGVELSKTNKNQKAEASAYNTLGTLYYNAGKYQKAIDYFSKATKIYFTVSDTKSEEYALKYLAKSNEALGRNDLSISYNNQAEQKATSDSAKTSYRFYNSKIKRKQGKETEAIKGLEWELSNNNSLSKKEKIDIYLELGDLYLSKKDSAKGVDLIDQALTESSSINGKMVADSLTINTLNSASGIYLNNGYSEQNVKTQTYFWDFGGRTNDTALKLAASNNLGDAYLQSENIPEAIASYEYTVNHLAANSAITSGDVVTLSDHLNNNVAFDISGSGALAFTDAPSISLDQIQAVEKLSKAYEKSGNYDKALSTYKQYIALVDSAKELELKGKLNNELLSAKYQIQESKIKDLELRQRERERAIKNQRWTILGLLTGLALLLLLTYFLVKNIRQKQKSNSLIRLASLRSQMNPHFIFNSLNSVNRFISENDEVKANSYLANFSKLMRSVLNNSNKESVALSDELKTLQIYLSLEHARFEDRFNYEIEVDSEIHLQNVEIPTMLIQPYLENAIWHGLRYKENNGFLRLGITQNKHFLEVEIEDNGIGRKESERLKTTHQKDQTSTGISNTKERIDILNKLNQTQLKVNIEDLSDGDTALGTKVTIQIPIIQQEEYA